MRLIVVALLYVSTVRADREKQTPADTDRITAQVALSATICAAQQHSAVMFRRLRDGIAMLAAAPRESGPIDQITRSQGETDRLDRVIDEVKRKLVGLRLKSLPCGQRDVKAVARCMTLGAEEFARTPKCAEPNVAIYLNVEVEGVPAVLENE